MDYVDEPLIGAGMLSIRHSRRIDNLHSKVVFQNLSHESVNSGTGTGDESEHIAVVSFVVERAFDPLNLALQASKSFDYHGFLSNGVRHDVTLGAGALQNSLETASYRTVTIELRPDQASTSICSNTYRKIPNGSSYKYLKFSEHKTLAMPWFQSNAQKHRVRRGGRDQKAARVFASDLITAHNAPSALFSVWGFTLAASASD
jgi:hypothetical protein